MCLRRKQYKKSVVPTIVLLKPVCKLPMPYTLLIKSIWPFSKILISDPKSVIFNYS